MRSRSAVGSCATLPHGVSNGRGSSDAVAQMADEQHVEIGEIVFLDGEIILGGEERRTVEAGRLQQRRGLGALRGRELAAIGRHEAALEPFADRQRVVRNADGAIDIGRRVHLVGPAHTALPALADQLLGRRGERIRHRIPDIGAAVAVEIDGVFEIIRRQELRQPHGAGPGAVHVGELDLALVEDFQRVAEIPRGTCPCACRDRPASPARGWRCGVSRGAAVIGFAAEDREHDGGIDAELPLDGGERARDIGRAACGPARRGRRSPAP